MKKVRSDALVDEVRSALELVPHLKVQSLQRVGVKNLGWDLIAEVRGRDDLERARLLIKCKTAAYPRDVVLAAHRFTAPSRPTSPAEIPVVIAPYLSRGAQQELRERDVGYVDGGGSAYLPLPWAVYHIEKPAPPRPARRLGRLFAGSSAQVLHALLLHPNQAWTVSELHSLAEVSLSTVHLVLQRLAEEGFVERRARGRRVESRLLEPGHLLDVWAAAHSLKRYQVQRLHYLGRSMNDVETAVHALFTKLEMPYALTLESGAARVAPFLTSVGRVVVLAPEAPQVEKVDGSGRFHLVEVGENVLVLVCKDRGPLMFRQTVKGMVVASNVQLYLDLWASPRRGKEQARHLRELPGLLVLTGPYELPPGPP